MMSESLLQNIMDAGSDALVATGLILVYFGIMLGAIIYRLKKNGQEKH